jgi:alpha-ketoglutaric semialdehyde dehydrogenase
MLEVRDPADVRTVVAEVPAMTAGEVAAAYDRARAGFETWRRTDPLDRAAVLSRAADLIRSRAGEAPSRWCGRTARRSPKPASR